LTLPRVRPAAVRTYILGLRGAIGPIDALAVDPKQEALTVDARASSTLPTRGEMMMAGKPSPSPNYHLTEINQPEHPQTGH
jgi:hypothetical protein